MSRPRSEAAALSPRERAVAQATRPEEARKTFQASAVIPPWYIKAIMLQYQVYLKAELGKLKIEGDARDFLEKTRGKSTDRCGLPADVDLLKNLFPTQSTLELYVDGRSEEQLKCLTKLLSKDWRNNNVLKEFNEYQDSTWEIRDLPTEGLLLAMAEPIEEITKIFKDNKGDLVKIADADSGLWQHKPYSDGYMDRRVEFDICLAAPVPDSKDYKIFDGIHRAIRLVRDGRSSLRLCIPGSCPASR